MELTAQTWAQMDMESAQVRQALTAYTLEWYGERCPDYEPDCACCKAWRLVDQFTELNDYTKE